MRANRSNPIRRLPLILAVLIAVLATVTVAPPSSAASVVASQPMINDYPWQTQPEILNPELRYYYRNCTDFVAWRLNKQAGVTSAPWRYTWSNLTPGGGHAYQWRDQFPGKVNNTPALGAVAWWGTSVGGGFGHVAIVSEVWDDGSVTVEEYNWNRLSYSTRRTRAESYIHIQDVHPGTGTPGSPIGNVDAVSGFLGGTAWLRGWVMDPDAKKTSTTLHAYVDGPAGSGARFVDLGVANFYRPDVPGVYPGSSANLGFSAGIRGLSPGPHTIYVYGINVAGTAGSNPLLKAVGVNIPNPSGGTPIGSTDTARGSIAATALAGWAIDPDVPTAGVEIHAYIDGPAGSGARGVNLGYARVARPDVAKVYPNAGPDHGYDTWVTGLAPGPHSLFVYAVNRSGGGDNPLLGILNSQVPSGAPVGNFEGAVDKGGAIRLTGWSIDPDAAKSGVQIHAYIDGPAGSAGARFVNVGAATVERPDVGKAYPGAGSAHGFDVLVPDVPAGSHTVYVYAINRPTGNNPLLGTKTVAVTAAPPPPPAASGPGPQPDSPAPVPPRASPDVPSATSGGAISVAVKAVRNRSRLRIDVNPDNASANYRVRVYKKVRGKWKRVAVTTTVGARDVRTINLRRGKYRVKAPSQHGLMAGVSKPVRLKR